MTRCDLLVTGAGGFVGQHLVKCAAEAGLQVAAVDWDLRDPAVTADRVAGVDPRAVAHLAASPRQGEPWSALRDDVGMLGSLLAALSRQASPAPLLVVGSASHDDSPPAA